MIIKITFRETFFDHKELAIKKKKKKVGSKTRHNMLQFGILGEKKMIEGFSKLTIQYAGYLIIVKGSSK